MNIALCDNNNCILEQLTELILEYRKNNRIEITIESYTDSNTLLSANKNYDIIVLDSNLCELNGLDTARKLREMNYTSAIIFLTNTTEYTIDAFEVTPFGALAKPVNKNKLYKLFDIYIKSINSDYPILIINNNGLRKIAYKDVYYLEADGKYCNIYLKDEVIHSSKTMSGILEQLPEYCFIKTHRSYVVNMYYIKSCTYDTIALSDNKAAYISKGYYKNFIQTYKHFIEKHHVKL